MASNSELYLMTQLLNLEGVRVIDYRIIEGIGIILSLEKTKKEVVCPSCEIIAYFDEGTTQGIVEGINNKLKLIKRRAFGFRNFDNFQLRSLLTWHFTS